MNTITGNESLGLACLLVTQPRLGFLLAHREGFADPHLVATMILFHDMQEGRTGDADKVQRRYLKIDERGAAFEQVQELGMAGRAIFQMWEEVETGSTEAGRIAKDAEILEMVFTARELVIRGNAGAQEWIENTRKRMKTRSGKELLEMINKADPSDWWKRICK